MAKIMITVLAAGPDALISLRTFDAAGKPVIENMDATPGTEYTIEGELLDITVGSKPPQENR